MTPSSSSPRKGPPIAAGRTSPHASFLRNCKRFRNINRIPIDYDLRPRLRGRLTRGQISFTPESLGFRRTGISPVFSLLMPAFSLPFSPANLTIDLLQPGMLLYHQSFSELIRSFGIALSPVTLSALNDSTSELLRTLLRRGCF